MQARLDDWAQLFSALLTKRKYFFLACFIFVYLLLACSRASLTLLENDELYTVRVATIPAITGIWSALLAGSDGNPPLSYVITRVFLIFFGHTSLAARLPAILGFLLMGICLFGFVRRRCDTTYAFLAMSFPFATAAFELAYYARPYGLVLGTCGLSLFCWQMATENRRRILALSGLSVSIMAAMFSHYYGFLIPLSLVTGELVRSFTEKCVDRPILASITVSSIPALLLLPLMKTGHIYSAYYWTRPALKSIPLFYETLLQPVIVAFLPLIVLLLFYRNCSIQTGAPQSQSGESFPSHEIICAVFLTTSPFVVGLVAVLYTKAFALHYAIVAVLGIAILLCGILRNFFHRRATIPMFLFVCLSGWFVVKQAAYDIRLQVKPGLDPAVYGDLKYPNHWWKSATWPSIPGTESLPVIIGDAHLYNQLTFYADGNLRSRLVYLTDRDAAVRFVGFDTDELLLPALSHWTDWKVANYREFILNHRSFIVCSSKWLLPQLIADHADIQLKDYFAGEAVYLVVLR